MATSTHRDFGNLTLSIQTFGRKELSAVIAAWTHVLIKWADGHDRYVERMRSDDPRKRDLGWWYRERTAVGFLNAAVWAVDGVAIEEYATHKRKGSRAPSRRTLSQTTPTQRGDFWMSLGGVSYACEAKSTLLYTASAEVLDPHGKSKGKSKVATSRFWSSEIDALIEAARKDSERCCEPESRRTDLVFAAPMLQLPGPAERIPVEPERVETVVRDFRETVDDRAKAVGEQTKDAAIIRAHCYRPLKAESDIRDFSFDGRCSYVCPGVSLLVVLRES